MVSACPEVAKCERSLKKLRRNRLLQLTPAGSQFCRGFEEHDLIKCKSNVQVVVSQGS